MIYFIQAGDDGPIKIGVTSGAVTKRLKQIQTTAPQPLKIIGEVDGKRQHESAIHKKLAEFGLRGEWFSPTPEVRSFISSVLEAQRLPEDLIQVVAKKSMRVMFVSEFKGRGINPVEALRAAVEEFGTQTAFAAKHGISLPYVNDVLRGHRDPGDKILDALGLEKVVTYRRKATK